MSAAKSTHSSEPLVKYLREGPLCGLEEVEKARNDAVRGSAELLHRLRLYHPERDPKRKDD